MNDLVKNFPDKLLLLILFGAIMALYLYTRTDFSGQLLQTIVGAILGIIGVRRTGGVEASTSSGDVQITQTPNEAGVKAGEQKPKNLDVPKD